jgi:hypothetical protein
MLVYCGTTGGISSWTQDTRYKRVYIANPFFLAEINTSYNLLVKLVAPIKKNKNYKGIYTVLHYS